MVGGGSRGLGRREGGSRGRWGWWSGLGVGFGGGRGRRRSRGGRRAICGVVSGGAGEEERGGRVYLWQLLTKKSALSFPRSRGIWPMPWAPSTRDSTPRSLQAVTRRSNGSRRPGMLTIVSNIATRTFPLSCSRLMVSLNVPTSSSSLIGNIIGIATPTAGVVSSMYRTLFSHAP